MGGDDEVKNGRFHLHGLDNDSVLTSYRKEQKGRKGEQYISKFFAFLANFAVYPINVNPT